MIRHVSILQLAQTGKTEEGLKEMFAPELEAFQSRGISTELHQVNEYDTQLTIKALEGADVALCSGNPPFDRKTLEQLPDLKGIVRYGIGVNSIDLEAATELGKIVFYMKGYCVEELALHASSLILGLLRNTAWYDRQMRAGNWMKGRGPQPRRLNRLTVGLFGLGGSGNRLASIMKNGFGANVIAYDPYVDEEAAKALGVRCVSFEELLAEADIISIHAPLTEETRHIFDRTAFEKMKPDSMLINISRGPIVDLEDLAEALKSGKIGSAGLDVFETEPLAADSPLLSMDQVLLTPHSAYFGKESFEEQKRLAWWLPTEWFLENRMHREYVANLKVLEKLL